MPRVAHILALAGVLNVSTLLCRSESIPAPEKRLVIFLTSDVTIAPAAFSEMKHELSHLLSAAAIHIEWLDPAVSAGGVIDDYSAVVRLRGSCRPTEPATRFQTAVPGPFPLASSAMADGVVLPFVEVDCGALNAFLGPSLWRTSDQIRESRYARAVARLMAHEIYHVVGQTHLHARTGIAEPAFTVAELLSDHFEFTEDTLSEIHPAPDVVEYSGPIYSGDVLGK